MVFEILYFSFMFWGLFGMDVLNFDGYFVYFCSVCVGFSDYCCEILLFVIEEDKVVV